jgi:hydroxypyruvate isomerase
MFRYAGFSSVPLKGSDSDLYSLVLFKRLYESMTLHAKKPIRNSVTIVTCVYKLCTIGITVLMIDFSASLGFLWTELPLIDAIAAAKAAGFDAVECHWPYETDPTALANALSQANIDMVSINAPPGNLDANDFGLAALPDRQAEAHRSIQQAIEYAAAIGATKIHVLAGITEDPRARATFIANLRYATDLAFPLGISILIEPLNTLDVPGYFLSSVTQAVDIIRATNRDNLALLFDCYHVEKSQGNTLNTLVDCLPFVGHIQFADTPNRSAPGTGTFDFEALFELL